MTVGFWRNEATDALRAAAAAMDRQLLVGAGDIAVVAAARSDVYAGLARVTALLLGGPPAVQVPGRKEATVLLGQKEKSTTRLFVGLQGAAVLDQQPALAAAEPGESGARVRRAADAIGVIGDILASHVPPGRRPDTLEGRQIRARGGVAGALADVARLAEEAIALDVHLPGWLDGGGRRPEMNLHPMARSANWAVNSQLGAAAAAVIAAGADRPRLLDELELSRQPLEQPPAITTVDAALTAVDAARTWLWQNPERMGVAHLQLVAQIGLAVHSLTDEHGSMARSRWRETALAVTELRGAPPVDTGSYVTGELADVLRWVRDQANRPRPDSAVGQDLARFAGHLPAMAATLHRGLDKAMYAKNLFLQESVLVRPAGSMVYRATQQWRPAARNDDVVRDLSRALWRLADPDTGAVPDPGRDAAAPARNRSSSPTVAAPPPRHGR